MTLTLVSVDAAAHTATDALDLMITADLGDGNQSLPYGWVAGDPYGLGPQIDAYMTAHPEIAANATPYAAPAPTGDDVDAERDRRRALPCSVTVQSGTFQVNMDATSQANIQGLATAGLYLSSTAPTQTTPFRDYANTNHDLLPSELVAMGLSVAAHIQALYQASWTLKAMSPIPADYATNESYWS